MTGSESNNSQRLDAPSQSEPGGFAALPDDGWHIAIDGLETGPTTKDQARATVQEAPSGAKVLVWHATLPNWIDARQSPLWADARRPPPLPVVEQTPKGARHALFSRRGRMTRLPYLLWSCLVIAVYMAVTLTILLSMHLDLKAPDAVAIRYLAALPFLWSIVALTAKRLHDLDRSGRHLLWVLPVTYASNIPGGEAAGVILTIGSALVELWLTFKRGTVGPNRFGADPLRSDLASATLGSGTTDKRPSRVWRVWAVSLLVIAGIGGLLAYDLLDGDGPACGDQAVTDKVMSIIGDKTSATWTSILVGEAVTYSLNDVRTLSRGEPLHGRTCAATVLLHTKSGQVEKSGAGEQQVTYTVQVVDGQDGRFVVTVEH